MAIYRAVGGVNREIKSITRAVSGVNQTAKEYYRGIGGVDRKVFGISSPLVPTLTSYTGSNGSVIKSGEKGTNYAWKVFDDVDSTIWEPGDIKMSGSGFWIGYKFNSLVRVTSFRWVGKIETNHYVVSQTFKLQGSNDGSSWVDLGTFIGGKKEVDITKEVSNSSSYYYYRIYWTQYQAGGSDTTCGTTISLQFYGY